MTTDVAISEEQARAALLEIEKIERAIDRAFQPIADSLDLRDRAAVEKHIKHLRDDIVKPYLLDNGGALEEAELGTKARIQPTYNSPTYDLVTAASQETGPADLADAAKAGMLRLDNGMLEKFRGSAGASWADRLFRFRIPGGLKSNNLYIDRGKN